MKDTSAHWRLRVAAAGGVLAAMLAATIAASPAAAQIPPITNTFDAVKALIGGPGEIASAVGASVLQDALEWLLGGLNATITLGLVKYLVHVDLAVGESLARLTGPMIVVGGWFLVVGLITSIGDGYREIVAGTDTAARVIGGAIFRVIGLAILLGSWFWVVPLAVDVANGISGYVLDDGAMGSALRRTFAGEMLLDGFPLLALLTGIMLAFAILLLVVLKFVIAIAFAALYVGGPALIGFAALPRVGNLPLAIATRGLLTLTIIPLLWTVVFAAWAGVSAGTFDAASGEGGAIEGVMGPGLFLAGLVVMLAVTKKVLSMATFGLPLSVPGTRIARSAATTAVTRRLGATSKGATAGSAATTTRPERSPPAPSTIPADQSRPVTQGSAGRRRPPESDAKARHHLPVSDPPFKPVGSETTAQHRRASAANSVLGVDSEGAFVPRRDVSPDVADRVTREIDDRGSGGEVSVEEVRQAGGVLTAADRSAFAAAATVARDEGPDRAQRHFARTASRQIAGAPALDRREREAAVTIASADPNVVQQAFASGATSPGGQSAPRPHDYDDRLFDPDRFEEVRRELEANRGGSTKRSDGDEEPRF